jgi:hypothetical protein
MGHAVAMKAAPQFPAGAPAHDPGAEVAGERATAVADAAAVPIVTGAGTTIRIGTASWGVLAPGRRFR